MKKSYFIVLFLLSLNVYSQSESIEIVLNNKNVIYTDWIELKSNFITPNPFVIIDNPYGKRIDLKDILNYKGTDQNSFQKRFINSSINLKKLNYREIAIKEDKYDKVSIFYEKLILADKGRLEKRKEIKYKFEQEPKKALNFKNVNFDLTTRNQKNEYLVKANQIRISQFVCISIGSALLATVLVDNFNPSKGNFMNDASKAKLLASGAFFVIPFTLEKSKEKNLLKAITFQE